MDSKAPNKQSVELEALIRVVTRALGHWDSERREPLERETHFRVATIALELARLRGASNTEAIKALLPDAAHLLSSAGQAWDWEIHQRPELEKKQREEEVHRKMVGNAAARRVPFDKLYLPGKADGGEASSGQFIEIDYPDEEGKKRLLRWKVFISEKGFFELVDRHIGNKTKEQAQELRALLKVEAVRPEPKFSEARQWIDQREKVPGLLKRLDECSAASGIERFVEDWVSGVAELRTNDSWREFKKNGIEIGFLLALAETRMEGNRVRSLKGIDAKNDRRVFLQNSSGSIAPKSASPARAKKGFTEAKTNPKTPKGSSEVAARKPRSLTGK